uniref:K Homology domain-containing protein n=1 Tax=Vitis vinifera TaxID=29760 RepID=A5C3R7_VITVI|nr:hypothetical protein VITISV_030085 [Vitis vinifera]
MSLQETPLMRIGFFAMWKVSLQGTPLMHIGFFVTWKSVEYPLTPMDSSSLPKRLPADSSTAASAEPTAKRRNQPTATSAASAATSSPPTVVAAGAAKPQVLFRILCPATKTGGVIGKGGAIIRQFREDTGAKIRIDDSVLGCDERVILIVADAVKSKREASAICGAEANDGEESANLRNSSPNPVAVDDDESSPAQQALVRVFERILKVDEEREEKEKKEDLGNVAVCCRLLAPSNQVGCVLGRGGKIVEKIRQESGAQIRVLPKDHIPACASPGDELIQVVHKLFGC